MIIKTVAVLNNLVFVFAALCALRQIDTRTGIKRKPVRKNG
jgi:hypothetical protein